MFKNLKRVSGLFLVAASMGLGVAIAHHLPASAQLEGTQQPAFCEGGFPSGQGKCIYENGDYYVGGFSEGLPSGQGVYVFENGGQYSGSFRAGRPDGTGRYITEDNTRYEGTYRNGNLVNGRVIFPNGDRYEGPFVPLSDLDAQEGGGARLISTSLPSGRGRYLFANGDRYEGEFFAGQIRGRGLLVRRDGTWCQADFYNNNLLGRGTCNYPGGLRYVGEILGGVPHGNGEIIDAKGKRFPGVFREGERVTLEDLQGQ